MEIKIIAAVAIDGTIGRGNAIPWHIPADLAHFRRLTLGQAVVMGSRTLASIGRALADRTNIVLTRRAYYLAPRGVKVARSIESAIRMAEEQQAGILWAIGGAEVYAAFAPLATEMHITRVRAMYRGDTHFPNIWAGWNMVSSRDCAARGDAPAFSFEVWRP
jgi:dihydrofolate reductase